MKIGLSNRVSAPLPASYTKYSLNTDRRDAGYKVFMEYELNRYDGFELGYFDLGKQGTFRSSRSSAPKP